MNAPYGAPMVLWIADPMDADAKARSFGLFLRGNGEIRRGGVCWLDGSVPVPRSARFRRGRCMAGSTRGHCVQVLLSTAHDRLANGDRRKLADDRGCAVRGSICGLARRAQFDHGTACAAGGDERFTSLLRRT